MFACALADKWGYSLARFYDEVTLEEMMVWQAYHLIQQDEMEKAQRRRG